MRVTRSVIINAAHENDWMMIAGVPFECRDREPSGSPPRTTRGPFSSTSCPLQFPAFHACSIGSLSLNVSGDDENNKNKYTHFAKEEELALLAGLDVLQQSTRRALVLLLAAQLQLGVEIDMLERSVRRVLDTGEGNECVGHNTQSSLQKKM